MSRYLMYDNDNGVGAYLLEDKHDVVQFAEDLMDELGDNPNDPDVNIFLITGGDKQDEVPIISRVWDTDWEEGDKYADD